MKTILLLINTDRPSFPLVRYLVMEGRKYGWKTCVASLFEPNLANCLKEGKFSSELGFIDIVDFRQCNQAIRKADLVIALVPDVMLLQVADSCIRHKKALITPSRLTRQMVSRKIQAEENDTLLLMECGFSPGLDHITAKKAIDTIHLKGGTISSFKTYSGSLVAEHCIDNPWKFKLTEPASEIINLGKRVNRHLMEGQLQHIPYHQLFDRSEPVMICGVKNAVAIPTGDSLYYRKIYQLDDARTVVKGKLMRQEFADAWKLIVKLGLTDDTFKIDLHEKSFYHFLNSLLPYSPSESLEGKLRRYASASRDDIERLKWLGLFDDGWMNVLNDLAPEAILRHLLEKKFELKENDQDCIVMQHQLEYVYKGARHQFTATLFALGENRQDSAIAKGVELTIGAAAKAYLLGNMKVKGLHIPTKKEIYDPIIDELVDLGITFYVEDKEVRQVEIVTEAKLRVAI
jgi:saccharopine dehydrogenase-like NADP-dependent oxidoreductase